MRIHAIAGLLLLALLAGCGTPGMPLPPSLELPQPVQDLRASRKGDTVYLVWTVPHETTDRTAVRLRHLGPTQICRSLSVGMVECSEKVGQVDTAQIVAQARAAAEAKAKTANRQATTKQQAVTDASKPLAATATAKDVLPHDLEMQDPTGFINYAVETMNTRGRSAGLSNQVQVPLAPTLTPPDDLSAKVTADGVVLSWTGALHLHERPQLRHSYRIYRREQGSSAPAALVGEAQLSTSPEGQLVDHSFEWQKTYEYWVAVVTIVSREGAPASEVEGDNSAPITVRVNDVYPPAVPSGLQAVFSGVGQQPFVDLTWAPNTDADLAGYNVYRREGNQEWTRLNTAPLATPSYRDGNVAAGRSYTYAVTAVDVHGNESARSQPAEEAVPSR